MIAIVWMHVLMCYYDEQGKDIDLCGCLPGVFKKINCLGLKIESGIGCNFQIFGWIAISHIQGPVATVIYLSEQMDCMGFNVSVEGLKARAIC